MSPDPKEVRAATTDGIKNIYLIILGLAISESLLRTFTKQPGDGEPLGIEVFRGQNLERLALLAAFLCTVVRFAHGALIHLQALSSSKKWHWDMLAFICQAILFFLTAVSIGTLRVFCVLLALTILADTLWLFALTRAGHSTTNTEKQWLVSNVLYLLILVVGSAYCPVDFVAATSLGVTGVLAAAWDYRSNRSFYFPSA